MSFLKLIFLVLLTINLVSAQTLKVEKISPLFCNVLLNQSIFDLEVKEVPKELKTTGFYLNLNVEGEKEPYSASCLLQDNAQLKKVIESTNDSEDLSFLCKLSELVEKDVEINSLEAQDIYGNSIEIEKTAKENLVLNSSECDMSPDASQVYMADLNMTFYQVSNFEILKDIKKVKYSLTVATSQIIPMNYSMPISVLLDGNEKVSICVSNESFVPEEGQILLATFECSVESEEGVKEDSSLVYGDFGFIFNPLSYNETLFNPSEVDKLIKEGKIKDVSKETKLPPIFTPESIATDNCNETGNITILGKFDQNMEEGEFKTIITDVEAICKYGKSEKDKETEIQCSFLDEFKEGRIIFFSGVNYDGYEELFFSKSIYTEDNNITCKLANATDNENLLSLFISFRQICKFEIKKDSNEIMFNLFVVVSKPLIKNEFILINVNLIKGEELVEAEANCTVLKDVEPKDGELLQGDLECKIDQIEKAEEFTGLEFASSEDISGVPSIPELLNPAEVDKLIESGKVLDYSLEENKKVEIPVFNATLINTTDSEKTGVFTIQGEFLSEVKLENPIEFVITLLTGEQALCTLPKEIGEGEVEIKCVLQSELVNSSIMIQESAGFDGYNEVIRLGSISSEKNMTIPNGKEIQLEKTFDVNLSFGQLNGYEAKGTIISFIFVGFITQAIKKDENIILEVNLIKGDELVNEEVTCTAIENVEPKEGEQLQVDFECKIEGIEKAEEYTGLELVESEDISGIPTNPDLLNPAKVDELIKEDKIKNYTSEDFKKEENVVFNCTSINTTDSEKTGVFILNGEILSKTDFKLEKSIEFEIILIGGEKALCTLPKITESGEIKIECVIQEELVDSKIMIQQCSALDGYNEIFKFNKVSSEEEVTLPNGKEIQLEKAFDINLSFGQLNGFGVEGGIISFMFIGFTTETITLFYL